MSKLNIGCSGFMYNHWRDVFYPYNVSKKNWFRFYTEVFNTVEMNVTFYRLLKETTFIKWYAESPEDFRFSIKGSRYITHINRLSVEKDSIDKFFNLAKNLNEKFSVVLWQLPPNFLIDIDRLKNFFSLLRDYRVRNAFEFRHQSWITTEVFNIFEKEEHSLCMADWPEFNDLQPVTSDFVYIRRHGKGGRYNSSYSTRELRELSLKIRDYLDKGIDVYVYFNNDANGYAPKNAKELIRLC